MGILSYSDFVNETEQKLWVAIEITTKDHFGKKVSSQRVITQDTYEELKSERRTRGGLEILYINALCRPTSDRNRATEFLDKRVIAPRKSKIDKRGADYVVYAINIGKLNPKGETVFGWNFWEECENWVRNGGKPTLFVSGYTFYWGEAGSLKVGDVVVTADNDSQRIINGGSKQEIEAIMPCSSKEEFDREYRKLFPNLCSSPRRAWGRMTDGLPWSYFRTVYSIKGIE